MLSSAGSQVLEHASARFSTEDSESERSRPFRELQYDSITKESLWQELREALCGFPGYPLVFTDPHSVAWNEETMAYVLATALKNPWAGAAGPAETNMHVAAWGSCEGLAAQAKDI